MICSYWSEQDTIACCASTGRMYCAGGISSVPIKKEGCNCATCALYDRCSSFNVTYFCVHGHCGAKDDRPVAMRLYGTTIL